MLLELLDFGGSAVHHCGNFGLDCKQEPPDALVLAGDVLGKLLVGAYQDVGVGGAQEVQLKGFGELVRQDLAGTGVAFEEIHLITTGTLPVSHSIYTSQEYTFSMTLHWYPSNRRMVRSPARSCL